VVLLIDGYLGAAATATAMQSISQQKQNSHMPKCSSQVSYYTLRCYGAGDGEAETFSQIEIQLKHTGNYVPCHNGGYLLKKPL
jgi:hypothetical protein